MQKCADSSCQVVSSAERKATNPGNVLRVEAEALAGVCSIDVHNMILVFTIIMYLNYFPIVYHSGRACSS